MRIQDYKIVNAADPTLLTSLVTDSLRLGWVPLGGVNVAISGTGGFWYSQAMVKHSGE